PRRRQYSEILRSADSAQDDVSGGRPGRRCMIALAHWQRSVPVICITWRPACGLCPGIGHGYNSAIYFERKGRMKTLLILRHASASWNNSYMTDHDRPLDSRGKR